MDVGIKIEDLRKSYGPVTALAGVSISVRAGEVVGLLGVNGAGKTTLLECLSGLREPDAGGVEVGGVDVRKKPGALRSKIGVVLPHLSLPEQITPREAVRLFATWRADPRKPEAVLDTFGIGPLADQRVRGLSQGQRQRLNLALAGLGEPAVMLLDEPSNGLDPAARHELQQEILRMRQAGRAVLLATHLLDEAESLCDRVAIIDRGRIIAEGTPAELAARVGKRQRVRIETAAVHADAWTEMEGVEEMVVEGNVVSFLAEKGAQKVAEALIRLEKQGIEVRNLEVRPARLEESFLRLTDAGREER